MPLVDPLTMSAAKGPSSPNAIVKAAKAPAVSPVPLHDRPLSRTVAAARPALLVALLALRFGRLVEDPVSTLTTALPVIAAVQSTYALVCLPVAGSQASRKLRPGDKKRDLTGPNNITAVLLSLALTAIVTPAVHVFFTLFGAPFLDHVAHTLLCAAHFGLLGLFPIFYARGIDRQALMAVAGACAPLDETFGALAGAVLGAWMGAVPIPLDWDREWQKWPVTIVVGLYVGSCMGSKMAGTLLYGTRVGGPSASAGPAATEE